MLTARHAPTLLPPADVESLTDELAARCVAWRALRGGDATIGFQDIVADALGVLGLYQRELAAEFQVAESTVSRWASGVARPHPRLQGLVVAAIGKRAARVRGKTGKPPQVKTDKAESKAGQARRTRGGRRVIAPE